MIRSSKFVMNGGVRDDYEFDVEGDRGNYKSRYGRHNSGYDNDLPTKEQTSTMYQSSVIPTSSVNTGQHNSNK